LWQGIGRHEVKAGIMQEPKIRMLERIVHALPETPTICEIGLARGETAAGIHEQLGGRCTYFGVDKLVLDDARTNMPWATIIERDSVFAHPQVTALDLLIIDGCHCESHVMLDFLHYGPKIRPGGYVFFHDVQREPLSQGMVGCPLAPDDKVGVYPALVKLHLLDGLLHGWRLEAMTFDGLGAAVIERAAANLKVARFSLAAF